MKFRIVRGTHIENGIKVYAKNNDVFEAKLDLVKRFNAPGSTKFVRVEDDTKVTKVTYPKDGEEQTVEKETSSELTTTTHEPDTLDEMNEDELRAFAESEGINLGNASKPETMVKKIREAMEG